MRKQFSFKRNISKKDIASFVKLTQDDHPLHTDKKYAKKLGFKDVVVHGMLGSAFFSTLVGKYLPKRQYMYVSQSLTFHKPLYPDQNIMVIGTLEKKTVGGTVLVLKTQIYNEAKELITSGIARVKRIR